GVSFIHDYLPWKISAGSSYDVVRTNETSVAIVGTAVYARWSDYVDRHNQRPAGAYAWYDTLGGSAGVRYQRGPLRGLFDAVYEPTPVPDQTGRTNYIDNDRLGGALGFDYAFRFLGGKLPAGIDPVTGVPRPLDGREGLQTNNPGWPGFFSAGWILGGSCHVTLNY